MRGKVTPASEVHHIVPVRASESLRLDRRNLISVCEECHREIEGKPDPRLCAQGNCVRLPADGGWGKSRGYPHARRRVPPLSSIRIIRVSGKMARILHGSR